MTIANTAPTLMAGPENLVSEGALRSYLDLVVRLVEALGAVVIALGALLAAFQFGRAALRGQRGEEFVRVRLGLGRYLTLGLEFQLASDVLSTAIAPSFSEIGKLAAVAAIRTALNYFLGKEIARERSEVEQVVAGPTGAPPLRQSGTPQDRPEADSSASM